jgi:glycerophosphoryl diester phosphodiesterase
MRKDTKTAYFAGLKALVLLAVIPVIMTCSAASKNNLSPDQSSPHQQVYVIGHRGAAGLAPENTLAGFGLACKIGVNAVELDVLLTGDHQIVVHHNYAVNAKIARTPDGKWIQASKPVIKETSLSELRIYDVGRLKPGTRYARRYPEQEPADGERVPTLDEVIELVKTSCGPATELWVEIKTNPEKPELTPAPETVADEVLRLLKERTVTDRSRILSFDWRVLAHVQKTAPDIPTVYLSILGFRFNNIKPGRPGASPWMAGLDIDDFDGSIPRAVQAAGGRYWAPYYRDLDLRRMQEAHELGVQVFAWTPDNREQMELLIDNGIDGIITNRPDILRVLVRGD